MSDARLLLYHGSNVPIERPQVSLNTGFADLGRGFYLICNQGGTPFEQKGVPLM